MKIEIKPSLSAKDAKVVTKVTFSPEHAQTQYVREAQTQTLVVGVKDSAPFTRRTCITLVRRIVRTAQVQRIARLAVELDALVALPGCELTLEDMLRLLGENMVMAGYEYRIYKTTPKEGWPDVTHVALLGHVSTHEKKALQAGVTVGEEVNRCRGLANTPGGDMTPTILAQRVRAAAKGSGASVRVLGRNDMETLKMGAILGVAQGAKEAPQFIIVEYKGITNTSAKPIVLVGKGITYDTGGLSLKPSPYMLDMHLDMSGGAAVAHAVIAAARLKLPVHAIALIPAAENAIGNESYRPGDVLRSMSGKTIDVLNTDAEGRLVLADALTYAARYKPALVVDVATLTGASLVALGTKASAVLTKDDALAHRLVSLGEESGDYLWPLPLWDEYKELVKGKHGDVSNISPKPTRDAGTIEGGMFLAEFAVGYPWAHIDMAPRMVSDSSDQLAEGAAGAPVRMLVRLLQAGV